MGGDGVSEFTKPVSNLCWLLTNCYSPDSQYYVGPTHSAERIKAGIIQVAERLMIESEMQPETAVRTAMQFVKEVRAAMAAFDKAPL